MNNQILILLLFFLIVTCDQKSIYNQPVKQTGKPLKYIKKTNTFYYQTDKNIDSIGYYVYKETGEIVSIVNIKIVDKYAYLSDPAHGNVKRIDLEDGTIIASEKLDLDLSWISSLAFYNDQLYVFTYRGKVYLLDKNLKTKGGFLLENYIGNIDIYSEGDDGIIIYRNSSEDIYQDQGNYLRRMIISKTNSYTIDTIPLNSEEYLVLLRKEMGKEVLLDNKLFFETSNCKYEIPDSLEMIIDYGCRNIDYSDDFFVTFTVDQMRLKLVVYAY